MVTYTCYIHRYIHTRVSQEYVACLSISGTKTFKLNQSRRFRRYPKILRENSEDFFFILPVLWYQAARAQALVIPHTGAQPPHSPLLLVLFSSNSISTLFLHKLSKMTTVISLANVLATSPSPAYEGWSPHSLVWQMECLLAFWLSFWYHRYIQPMQPCHTWCPSLPWHQDAEFTILWY